jgi:hypothetical protein
LDEEKNMRTAMRILCLVLTVVTAVLLVACSGDEVNVNRGTTPDTPDLTPWPDESTDNDTVTNSEGYVSIYGGGYLDIGTYIRSDFDENGKEIKTSFYDLAGQHGIVSEYMLHTYEDGRLVRTDVYGFENTKAMYMFEYTVEEFYKWQYDGDGKLVCGESYRVKENGVPVINNGGHIFLEYGDDGKLTAVTKEGEMSFNYDDGKLSRETVLTTGEYALFTYGDDGKIAKSVAYFNDGAATDEPRTTEWKIGKYGDIVELTYSCGGQTGKYEYDYSAQEKLMSVKGKILKDYVPDYEETIDVKVEYSQASVMTHFVSEHKMAA